jgi:hypothetical protein
LADGSIWSSAGSSWSTRARRPERLRRAKAGCSPWPQPRGGCIICKSWELIAVLAGAVLDISPVLSRPERKAVSRKCSAAG